MAITVNIYYSGVNGNAKKFVEEMVSSGVVGGIRAEDGNIKYEYFFLMDDKETVLLIDSWKDQHSIDVHHASPMLAKITKLREKNETAFHRLTALQMRDKLEESFRLF